MIGRDLKRWAVEGRPAPWIELLFALAGGVLVSALLFERVTLGGLAAGAGLYGLGRWARREPEAPEEKSL